MFNKYSLSRKVFQRGEIATIFAAIILAIITTGIFVGNSLLSKRNISKSDAQVCVLPDISFITPSGTTIPEGNQTIQWAGITNSTPAWYQIIIDDRATPYTGSCPYNFVGHYCQTLTATQTSFNFIVGHTYDIQLLGQNTCGYQNLLNKVVTAVQNCSPATAPTLTSPTNNSSINPTINLITWTDQVNTPNVKYELTIISPDGSQTYLNTIIPNATTQEYSYDFSSLAGKDIAINVRGFNQCGNVNSRAVTNARVLASIVNTPVPTTPSSMADLVVSSISHATNSAGDTTITVGIKNIGGTAIDLAGGIHDAKYNLKQNGTSICLAPQVFNIDGLQPNTVNTSTIHLQGWLNTNCSSVQLVAGTTYTFDVSADLYNVVGELDETNNAGATYTFTHLGATTATATPTPIPVSCPTSCTQNASCPNGTLCSNAVCVAQPGYVCTSVTNTPVPGSKADLVVTEVSHTTNSSNGITMTTKIKNGGGSPVSYVGALTNTYEIKEGATVRCSASVLQGMAGAAAGAIQSFTTYLPTNVLSSCPQFTPVVGTQYTLYITLDPTNSVNESNESNNTYSYPFTYGVPPTATPVATATPVTGTGKADLTVNKVTHISNSSNGITVTTKIKNAGTKSVSYVGALTNKYEIKTGSTVNCSANVLQGMAGVAAGAISTFTTYLPTQILSSCSQFTPVVGTQYTLEITLDPDNIVDESNETNNTFTYPFTYGVAPTSTPPNATATPTTTVAPTNSPTPISCINDSDCPSGSRCQAGKCSIPATPTKQPTATKIPAPTVCKGPKPPKWSPGVVRNNDKLQIGWENSKDGLVSIVEVCINGGASCRVIFSEVTKKIHGITKTLDFIKSKDILVQISVKDTSCDLTSDTISRPLAAGTSTALNTPTVTINGTGPNKGTSTWIIVGGAFIVVIVVAAALVGM